MPILTPEERIGTLIAERYRIEGLLGQGGMGVVMAGKHELTERRVAIKLLLPTFVEEPELVARFFQEAKAAAALNHPNVVDVLDMGQDGTDAYLALEFLEGQSLQELLEEKGTIETGDLLAILLPVIDALSAAHSQRIVHRDLKPDNIFIHRDMRGRAIPKVLDFGIAKLLEIDTGVKTRTGGVLGTPHYMSPEQAQGMKSVGPESDIWSMGVVLYECLCGEKPFAAESIPALLLQICTFDPLPLTERTDAVHPAIAAVVQQAFDREKEIRFSTMEELGGALMSAAKTAGIELPAKLDELFPHFEATGRSSGGTGTARTSTGPIDAKKVGFGTDPTMLGDAVAAPGTKKSKLPLIGAALVVLLLVFGGVGAWAFGGDPEPLPVVEQPDPVLAPVPVPVAVPVPVPVPEPPPVESIMRSIQSDPPEAEVYMDGDLLGNTPFEVDLATIEGQTMEVELRAPGRRNRTVSIGPDSSPVVVVNLPRARRERRGGDSAGNNDDLAPR